MDDILDISHIKYVTQGGDWANKNYYKKHPCPLYKSQTITATTTTTMAIILLQIFFIHLYSKRREKKTTYYF